MTGPAASRRVLLVGATGVFGSRLAGMLADAPGVQLVLAARRLAPLRELQARLQEEGAAVEITAFDRTRPELTALKPWLVVDAAGPFQGGGYGLALAAVHAGAHYVDLADARDFLAGFPAALGTAADATGVLAVTGASSTPALSHAALERITRGWLRLDEVVALISPGARAPRGLAVMESILSYVGQPVRLFKRGGWTTVPGWSDLRKVDMPGLGRRWAALCETPDLDLLPARFPVRRSALFMAGLELAPMHLGLATLGLLVRWRLLPSLRPLARPLRAGAALLAPFGSDRGGMLVEAIGLDEHGRPVRARWALWAEANAGPSTPAAPAAALISALAAGRETRHGACSAAGLLDLDAALAPLASLPIRTRADESWTDSSVRFERLLGGRLSRLPPSVRAVHGGRRSQAFAGEALARSGSGVVAKILRLALGLPPSGRSTVEVTISPDARGETWRRRFGKVGFSSRLVDVRGRQRPLGVFEERFGPARCRFELLPTSTGVRWRLTGWSVLGLPLPRALAPRVRARADEAEGRYRFRVLAAHPWIGLLFAYRGTLGAPR